MQVETASLMLSMAKRWWSFWCSEKSLLQPCALGIDSTHPRDSSEVELSSWWLPAPPAAHLLVLSSQRALIMKGIHYTGGLAPTFSPPEVRGYKKQNKTNPLPRLSASSRAPPLCTLPPFLPLSFPSSCLFLFFDIFRL